MTVHRFPAPHRGLIHVRRVNDDDLIVEVEGRGGSSWAILERFNRDDRDKAVRFALDRLGDYPGAVLGEVQR